VVPALQGLFEMFFQEGYFPGFNGIDAADQADTALLVHVFEDG
jgi:hypothetical protein